MAKRTIEEVTALTPEQEQMCKEMEALYDRMQEAGIAFAMDEDANVVVYNAQEIDDCENGGCLFTEAERLEQAGFEYVEQNDMRKLFPVWACDTLYVKRK